MEGERGGGEGGGSLVDETLSLFAMRSYASTSKHSPRGNTGVLEIWRAIQTTGFSPLLFRKEMFYHLPAAVYTPWAMAP